MPLHRKRNAFPRASLILVVSLVVLIVLVSSYMLHLEISKLKFSKSKTYISKTTVLWKRDREIIKRIKFSQFQDFDTEGTFGHSSKEKGSSKRSCTKLKDCFNFEKCSSGFQVYVYPLEDGQLLSPMYQNIINSIQMSHFYTDNPSKACLFIPSLDTHDRDIISRNYVKHLDEKFLQLPLWNSGENHAFFNLYSGTFPDYRDRELMFDTGKAFSFKASYSKESVRQQFDISIPLLPSSHPMRVVKNIFNKSFHGVNFKNDVNLFPVRRKYLIAFKGKRYLTGIGSETRNSLHLINNDKDVILLTTCRHGKSWEKYKDPRCDEDNEKFDRYDYIDLLVNSTFCIIPRGRRLGSFRFLESMKYGCIPILLSNSWDLPFSEVIDWSKFSFNFDERLLLQIPSILRKLSDEEILSKRQQVLFVWENYFESIEKITYTALEIFHQRIHPDLYKPYLVWNQSPGALDIDMSFTTSLQRLPFYHNYLSTKPIKKFTAIIVAFSTVYRSSSSLFRLIKSINRSSYLDQILVIWLPDTNIPDKTKWPNTKVTLRVIHPPKKTMNSRYTNIDLITTDAVFTFDEDVVINTSEVDFAFMTWFANPTQLVGFSAASHYLDSTQHSSQWRYTSKLMNEYSIIHTSAAIYHKYYNHLYTLRPPKGLLTLVEQSKTCESLAMNFLISSITNKPPIKVARSTSFIDGSVTKERLGTSFTLEEHFNIRQKCFGELIGIFNDLPLVNSTIAMNPVLYKDIVSISRKKYRRLE